MAGIDTFMKIIEKFIKIDTPRTSLIFRRYDELLETIYYGVRVNDAEDYNILSSHKPKYSHSCVDNIIAANFPVTEWVVTVNFPFP